MKGGHYATQRRYPAQRPWFRRRGSGGTCARILGAAEAAHATCIDYAQFMRTRSTLALAGAPWKATIGNGMAYVAVGIGGMRIVDYWILQRPCSSAP